MSRGVRFVTHLCVCVAFWEVFQRFRSENVSQHQIKVFFTHRSKHSDVAVRSELQQVTITRSLPFYTAVLFFCCSATHAAFPPPQAVHIMVGLLNIGLGASLATCSSPYPFWLGGMVISNFCPGHLYLKYAHLFTLYSLESHPKGLYHGGKST